MRPDEEGVWILVNENPKLQDATKQLTLSQSETESEAPLISTGL
jgi:hypothetical protein